MPSAMGLLAERRPFPAVCGFPSARPSWELLCASAAALLAVTIIAYLPAFSADFIQWDDQYYVTENRLLHDVEGLKRIWNPRAKGGTDQYYPLTFTSYWIEYRLWRLNAYAYHATNVVLHLVNALLVWLVISAFGVSWRVAAMTAAVFALHPVQVASVVWIAERKNTLSTTFYLLTFFLYLQHRRRKRWDLYAASLGSFAAALLSKTQTLSLPVSLFLADWVLQRLDRLPHRPLGRVVARVMPFVAFAGLAAATTMLFEARPWTRNLPPLHRMLVAANAAWFYAGTFVAPLWLSPIYPEWPLSEWEPRWWIAVVAWGVVAALLLRRRDRIQPLVLWGVVHFYAALAPVMGLFAFNFQTYAFVADHFLYLSVIGGGLLAALAAEAALGKALPRQRQALVAAAILLALAGAAVLTYREARHWRNNRSFWVRVIQRYPESFFGYFNLGRHYRRSGEWDKAVFYYRRAAAIRPEASYAFRWYIDALTRAEGPRAVVEACNTRIATNPDFFPAYYERGVAYERLGRRAKAMDDFRRVLRLAPKDSTLWKSAQRHMRGRPARSRR